MNGPRIRQTTRRVRAAYVPSSAATRERGHTLQDPNGWWKDLTNESTPELRWPESVKVFEDMVRQDAQASSVLSAIATPIMRTGWRVDGTGCRDEVTQHVAADLGLPIAGEANSVPATRTRGRFSWTEHLGIVVPDHLQFGHAVFEQVYYPPRSVLDGGDGLYHLRKLGYRPARTISAWKVAPDGGLIGVQQYATQMSSGGGLISFGDTSGVTLPVDRLVVYTNRRKGGNWAGESVLRSAYKNVMLKDRYLRVDAMVVERNGLGIPVHTAAGGTAAEIEAGLDIASGVQAGDNSGVSLAHGATFDLKGVTGTLPDILEKVKYHDEQIARAVLAHFLNLGSQTGSWALGATFADFFTLSIQAVAENIRETATRHIVEDIVDINYGPDEPAPRIVFDEIGSRQGAILTAIAQLVSSGVIHPDEDLEKFIRSTLDLPLATSTPAAAGGGA
ncbi:phage portal protein family protein [Microbacterium sp. KNMS]